MRNEAGGKSLLAAAESAEGAILDDIVYHVAVTHRDVDGFGHNTGTPTAPCTWLFIDGEPISAAVELVAGFTDYTLTKTSGGLYCGTATSAGQGFIGLVDDLQVYRRELTPADLAGTFSQPGKTAFNLEALDYRITAVRYNPVIGSVTLNWNAVPGAVYSVQQCITFTTGAGPRRFFQILRASL